MSRRRRREGAGAIVRELRALRADLRALADDQNAHREAMVDGILDRGARFLRAALDETSGRTVTVDAAAGRAVSFVGNDTREPSPDLQAAPTTPPAAPANDDDPPHGTPRPAR